MVTICEVKHKHPLVCVSLQSYIAVVGAGLPSPAAISAQQQDLALAWGIRESSRLEKTFKIMKSTMLTQHCQEEH